MYKFLVLAAVLAYAHAGLLGAPIATTYAAGPALAYGHAVPAALTSQSANILRSYGNLGQVSTYTKTIDTPYSSVSKSDVRVSNPGLATVAHAPIAYAAAPAVATYAHAAPVIAARTYGPAVATVGAAPVVARTGLLGVAYSAAPAVSHIDFDGLGVHYAW